MQRGGLAVDLGGVNGLVHLVAHTRHGYAAVAESDSAEWLWKHLGRAFPEAVASELMPDHLHGVVPGADELRVRLGRLLRHHSRRFGARWDVGPATPVHTIAIARRTARYIALNPVRAQLVDDPLEWPWSTLRDAMGATATPWGGADGLARYLEMTPAQFHAYVVSDERCTSAARRPTLVLHAAAPMAASLGAIAEACAAALRTRPEGVRVKGSRMRATFVALAYRVGAPRQADLADACGVSTRAIRALRRAARPADIQAAFRCLVDPRLRRWSVPTARSLPKHGS